MTFDEFIVAIKSDHLDPLTKGQVFAFIQNASIEVLGAALEVPGVKSEFAKQISLSLSEKVPGAQAKAAIGRIDSEFSLRKGPK